MLNKYERVSENIRVSDTVNRFLKEKRSECCNALIKHIVPEGKEYPQRLCMACNKRIYNQ